MKVLYKINTGCYEFKKKPEDEPSTIAPTPPGGDDDPYDEGKRDVND